MYDSLLFFFTLVAFFPTRLASPFGIFQFRSRGAQAFMISVWFLFLRNCTWFLLRAVSRCIALRSRFAAYHWYNRERNSCDRRVNDREIGGDQRDRWSFTEKRIHQSSVSIIERNRCYDVKVYFVSCASIFSDFTWTDISRKIREHLCCNDFTSMYLIQFIPELLSLNI